MHQNRLRSCIYEVLVALVPKAQIMNILKSIRPIIRHIDIDVTLGKSDIQVSHKGYIHFH